MSMALLLGEWLATIIAISWQRFARVQGCLANTTPCRRGCVVVSGDSAFVMMMQPTDFPHLDESTSRREPVSSALRSVFAERQMSAPAMVIGT